MAPARTLREAFRATDHQPLPSGDPYFVDLTQARGSAATVRLKQMIQNCDAGQHAAIAFSGHRGSGKSTELLQLRSELASSCFTLYLDINEFLDAADVDYTDLFLLVSRSLLDSLRERNVPLGTNLLGDVEDWFMQVTKETEQSIQLAAGIGAEAQAGVSIPFVGRLLAKLTSDVKAGSSQKKTTREELDRYFSGLLNNTNVLLTSAAQALQEHGRPSQLLIVFDNLDRLPPDKSEKLFFDHGSQLRDMACHAVYTVSIDTFYSRRGLFNVFPSRVILPNVKVRAGKSSKEPYQAGFEAMREVVGRRLDAALFMNAPSLVDESIRLSGGSVRQLIRLLREAVLSAQSRELAAIDSEALEDAARNLRQDFERMLAPADYSFLQSTRETKSIKKDDGYMGLLSNLSILEYNGSELWYDVNPLIEPIHAFQVLAKKSRGKAPGR